MFPLRQIRRPVCCVLVGMLLFAQAAFATRPCVEPGMSAMSAMSAMAEQSSDDCCAMNISKVNLCVMKCADGDKLPGSTQLITLPAPTVAALTLPLPQVGSGMVSIAARLQRDLVPDPPPNLRFCSFLI